MASDDKPGRHSLRRRQTGGAASSKVRHSPGYPDSPIKQRSESTPARDAASELQKASAISAAVQVEAVATLRQLAISRGGLVSDALRRQAWHTLLEVDVSNIPPCPERSVLHAHRDYNQVVLDVNRSIKRFPPGMQEEVRLSYQDQLVDTIMRVLVHQPELHYYQGYHDIVVTFLLVVGEDLTFALMNELSAKHLRNFMHKTMDQTNSLLHYLYPIVSKASPELADFMLKAEVGTIFCLPWLITWYGHVLNDFRHIVRLYDYFIACDPLMPIYLAAAIVLHREKEILACEPEMPIVHSLLSRIPPDLPMERLVRLAGDLFVMYPPAAVEEEARQQHLREQEKLANNQAEAQEARALRERHRRLVAARQRGGGLGRQLLVRVSVWTVAATLTSAAALGVWYGRWSPWPW